MHQSVRDMKLAVSNAEAIELASVKNAERGDLFIAETQKHIPFEVKRVFFINNFQHAGNIHGNHAHYALHEVILCANGHFTLILDDGFKKQEILMDDPSRGILMKPRLWRTMTSLSKDCVILVFSDSYFDNNDYIRNYQDFLNHVRGK